MSISVTDQFDDKILKLVNQERIKLKLNSLTLNEKLDTAADLHSKDMAEKDYFSHTGTGGSTLKTRIDKTGYKWTAIGENIAAGYTTPEAVVKGWMNSAGHRANILNPKFTQMGLGYTFLAADTGKINYRHYWTQVFGAGDPNYSASTFSLSQSSASLINRDELLGVTNGSLLVGNDKFNSLTNSPNRKLVQIQNTLKASPNWIEDLSTGSNLGNINSIDNGIDTLAQISDRSPLSQQLDIPWLKGLEGAN